MKYYHGGYGKLKVNDMVLPPSVTGAPSCADFGAGHVCRRDRVYITTDLESAAGIAAFHPSGKGKVYEVHPVGELEPDPDCLVKGLSFQAEKARVCRVIPLNIAMFGGGVCSCYPEHCTEPSHGDCWCGPTKIDNLVIHNEGS